MSRTRRLISVREDAKFDAVSFLSVYLFTLMAIPSQLVVGPLGGAGTPAQIVGLIGLLWWIWDRLHRSRRVASQGRPVRTAMVLFCAAILASYVVGMIRAVNADESNIAVLGLVTVASWAGVFVVANDGIVSQARLVVLLRRFAFAGGSIATLGLVQFITHQQFTDLIQIPGLSANSGIYGTSLREGFTRPSGTAVHPIEFGAVLTMVLPIALTLGLVDRSRSAMRRWYPSAIIGLMITLSISRSAIVGAVIGLILLIPTWPVLARRIALSSIVVLLIGIFVTVPGMLGSLTGLFTSIGSDTSAQSRTDSYPLAWEFVTRSPFFGRGYGTFLPRYRIFDNQYLLLLVEIGVVGLIAFLALVVVAISTCSRTRRATRSETRRRYAQGLLASVAAGAGTTALFDAFSFPMAAGTLFLTFGLCGALARLTTKSPARMTGPESLKSQRH